MPKKLDDDALERALGRLPAWRVDGTEIVRTYAFGSYRAAVGFAVEVALLAEREDHHPDLVLRYGSVEVRFTTHDAGGLSERDLALATACDEAHAGRGAP